MLGGVFACSGKYNLLIKVDYNAKTNNKVRVSEHFNTNIL